MSKFISVQLDQEQQQATSDIKDKFQELFDLISSMSNPSREGSLVVTKLEEACMWATKNIVINGLKK